LIYYLLLFPCLHLPLLLCAEARQDLGEVSNRVVIKSKGDGGIIIDGRQYLVLKSTTILDVSGKEITLCDLKVPSEAVVEYRVGEDLVPVCIRIENKRLLQGATSLVIADDPG